MIFLRCGLRRQIICVPHATKRFFDLICVFFGMPAETKRYRISSKHCGSFISTRMNVRTREWGMSKQHKKFSIVNCVMTVTGRQSWQRRDASRMVRWKLSQMQTLTDSKLQESDIHLEINHGYDLWVTQSHFENSDFIPGRRHTPVMTSRLVRVYLRSWPQA